MGHVLSYRNVGSRVSKQGLVLRVAGSGTGPGDEGVTLSGRGNSNSHGARPVHLITTMIKWIRTGRLSMKNFLSQVGCRYKVLFLSLMGCNPPERESFLIDNLLVRILFIIVIVRWCTAASGGTWRGPTDKASAAEDADASTSGK